MNEEEERSYGDALFPLWLESQPPDSWVYGGYLAHFSEAMRLKQFPGNKLSSGTFAGRNLEGVKVFRHGNGFALEGTKVREHTAARPKDWYLRKKTSQGSVHSTCGGDPEASLRDSSAQSTAPSAKQARNSDDSPW